MPACNDPSAAADRRRPVSLALLALLHVISVATAPVSPAAAQCPAAPTLASYDAAGRNPCLCLIQGDEVGVIFQPPASDFPLEILKVGVYWASQFGGNPSSTEQGLHIYNGTPPNPGSRIFTLAGPTLNDGQMNVFDLEPQPGNILVGSGPILVALEILNQSSGNQFASSVVDDQNGCLGANRNWVFTGGQWFDACTQGVGGDWVFELVYRPCTPPVPTEEKSWGRVKTLYR